MKKSLILVVVLVVISAQLFAAIDTIQVYSNSMFKNVKCVVITPTTYKAKADRYPVIYLLHGYSGNYADWVKRVPGMQKLADDNELLIVCPDGAFDSWYFDSPVDLTRRFETNVAKEIPDYIDANYRTIANRNARAITGLSMGGHGGLFLGLRHGDRFGACGSMSGALDVSGIRGYGMDKVLGDTVTNASYYKDWSVINTIEKYPKDSVAMIIDCGTEITLFVPIGGHTKSC
jgi:S-formylglutathione hydrolase FrmB